MNRSKKEALVNDLREELSKSNFVYIFEQVNVSVAELSKVRLDAALSGITIRFIKNTLAKRAVANDDLEFAFSKANVIAYGSGDPLEAAGILSNYEKEYSGRLKVKCGTLDGSFCDKDLMTNMSKMGSVDSLKQMLLGMLQSSYAKFAMVVNLVSEKMGEEK